MWAGVKAEVTAAALSDASDLAASGMCATWATKAEMGLAAAKRTGEVGHSTVAEAARDASGALGG